MPLITEQISNLINGVGEKGVSSNKDWRPEYFKSFCPVAFSGIKDIPHPALTDRCIVLKLQKVSKDKIRNKDKLKTHKPKYLSRFVNLQSKLLRWSQDVELDDDVEMSENYEPRFMDNWRPLFSIAEAFGDKQIAIDTANNFIFDEIPDTNNQLLKDMIDVFGTEEKMHTKEILDCLNLIPEYQNFNFGKGISDRKLSARLGHFDIKPTTVYIDGLRKKGYKKEDFVKEWEVRNWLTPQLDVTSVKTAENSTSSSYPKETSNGKDVNNHSNVTPENSENPSKTPDVTDLTFKTIEEAKNFSEYSNEPT